MSVAAVDGYEFPARDAVANFNGRQILYINWEKHTLFARPMAVALTPDTPFSEVTTKIIPEAFAAHPDFARIDWSKVEWIKSGEKVSLDPAKSLAANGLGHKDLIRMVTPGLDGLNGMGI